MTSTTPQQQTIMYSQLQPWSTAGAPPCMEQVSGPEIPPRTGNYYQVISDLLNHIKITPL